MILNFQPRAIAIPEGTKNTTTITAMKRTTKSIPCFSPDPKRSPWKSANQSYFPARSKTKVKFPFFSSHTSYSLLSGFCHFECGSSVPSGKHALIIKRIKGAKKTEQLLSVGGLKVIHTPRLVVEDSRLTIGHVWPRDAGIALKMSLSSIQIFKQKGFF